MKRLGYTHYVAQGGDFGAPISHSMARQAPAGLLGIHINLPATLPSDVAAALATGGPAPEGLSGQERAVFDSLASYYKKGERGLSGGNVRAAAGHRVWPDGLSFRSRGVDPPAPGFRAVDLRRRSRKVPDKR